MYVSLSLCLHKSIYKYIEPDAYYPVAAEMGACGACAYASCTTSHACVLSS